MTMTPTNAEGLAAARAALGRRTTKHPAERAVDRWPLAAVPSEALSESQRLAWVLRRTADLERMAALAPRDEELAALALTARGHVDQLCLDADLWTHLDAAAMQLELFG